MATSIPSTMRALVAPRYCGPKDYVIAEIPTPTIQEPDDVLIKVHAAGLQAGDTQFAAGAMRILGGKLDFPIKLGIEGSGVVLAVGPAVTTFRPGDAVYGAHFMRPLLPLQQAPGFAAEYAVTRARFLVPKPPGMAFEDVAGLMANTITAYQAVRRGLELAGWGSLEGRSVFVPGGLSGTGSVGGQVIRRAFGAARLVTTVSTAKVPMVEELLPGVYDRVIDYKTQDVVEEAGGGGTFDLVYNTQWDLPGTVPLTNPETGIIVSIASAPAPGLFADMVGPQNMPFWMWWVLGLGQWYYAWLLRGTRIKYEFVSGNPAVREDVERAGEIIARGWVKPVSRIVRLDDDIEELRRNIQLVKESKGGVGKLVIKVV